ncbi:MAG: hypothetical protein P8179_08865 [Candidatus Thiodiazotropha sp.]
MRATLDHLPEPRQQEIQTIVDLLQDEFKRVCNNKTSVENFRFWTQVEERIQKEITAPFSPIVHSLRDVNAQLKEGHYLFKDIRQDGVLLYDGNHKALVAPRNLSP